MLDLDRIRRSIPLVQRNRVYLDNAGAGPPPSSVVDEMQNFLADWRDEGEKWDKWLLEVVDARKTFAKLIGADEREVACIPNVTTGLIALASSLDYESDSNVVVSELNFPTNISVWQLMRKRGIIKEVRLLRKKNGQIPIEDYGKAIDEKTRVVSIDYVSWINGCREHIREIAELAHERGALIFADGFHALGAMPVDVRGDGVDAFTCGAYKWLMGPHGVAFLYVNGNVLDHFSPKYIGWHGIKESVINRLLANKDPFSEPFPLDDAEPDAGAARFEWGTWSTISVVGAKAAMKFIQQTDPKERFGQISRVNQKLTDGLQSLDREITSPLEEERKSGIVTFEDRVPGETVQKLSRKGITVVARVSTIRVSPHFYNTTDEIDIFLKELKAL